MTTEHLTKNRTPPRQGTAATSEISWGKAEYLQHQLQQKKVYGIDNTYKFCETCQRTFGTNIKPKSKIPTCGRVSLCPQCGCPFWVERSFLSIFESKISKTVQAFLVFHCTWIACGDVHFTAFSQIVSVSNSLLPQTYFVYTLKIVPNLDSFCSRLTEFRHIYIVLCLIHFFIFSGWYLKLSEQLAPNFRSFDFLKMRTENKGVWRWLCLLEK